MFVGIHLDFALLSPTIFVNMGQQTGLPTTPFHQPPLNQSSQRDVLDKLAEMQKQAYDTGATYAKALVGIGFAGFLTIWTTTRDLLGPRQKPLAALLLSVSLFVYIGFEVSQMIYQGALRLSFARQIGSGRDLATVLREHDDKIKKYQSKWVLAWYLSLVLTVIPGFTGGGILIYAFLWRVFH